MLSTLHLVRHGEVHNPEGVVYADMAGFDLSTVGQHQAAAAAAHLKGEPVAAILTSPLQRAVSTASAIAAGLDLDLVVDERLTEWRVGQRWAGVAWAALPTRFPGELEAYLEHPTDLPFAPEAIGEVALRVAAVVDQLGGTHPGGTAVLVSHQDPLQAARLLLCRRDLSTLHHDKPGHAAVVTLSSTPDPWTEVSAWAPAEASAPFPPLDPASGA